MRTLGNHLDRPMVSQGNFKLQDFIECGEAYAASGIDNSPENPESIVAIEDLANIIIEPVMTTFGNITLTSGFRSHQLLPHIKRRAAPKLDQHCAYETNSKGNQICSRGGFAVDFIHDTVDSLTIAKWVVEHCPYDRLYFYGKDRPLHVSYGPEHSREIVVMIYHEELGRYMPRATTKEQFLGL